MSERVVKVIVGPLRASPRLRRSETGREMEVERTARVWGGGMGKFKLEKDGKDETRDSQHGSCFRLR